MSVGWTCPGVDNAVDCVGHNGKDGKKRTPCREQGEPKTPETARRVAERNQQRQAARRYEQE